MKSNLEPIEESDLDLEGKIKNGSVDFSREEAVPAAAIEREAIKEVSAAEKDDAYGKILSKVQTVQTDDELDQTVIAADAKTGYEKMDAESQVQHLVDIAGQKGVVHAVKVAQHMQDNYVLDTFHDRMLGEELHNALVEKGMIKEI
ncbi:MAG: hypothetical protein UR95_C0001G0076 [Parcubacteria group bacterium GW2011_GWC1_36_108]|nr:MAG: hypothetical protein UR95_C0001G0076 [Parcubacteria group bacterium GW2011_GWC1_36_108]KKQ00109.1 MAG: hypothetical protein US09_C0021G0029 [Candidatus Moranbacteria bacterium GW2011_GWD1_36_198]